jgi:YHS domain-containing protein
MKKTNVLAGLTAALLLVSATFSFAAEETQQDANGVILSGHDAVSYFTANKATKGYAGISTIHDGAIYHFSSEGNRDLFKANPSKYAPQYGGFCAYGAAIGAKFPVDPTVFAVVDNKLYVNNSANVSKLWTAKQSKAITLADKKWSKIKATPSNDVGADDDLADE